MASRRGILPFLFWFALAVCVLASVAQSAAAEPKSGVEAAEPCAVLEGPSRYEKELGWAASVYGVSPELLRALIQVESSNRARVTSVKGANGLMQLMPATARSLGVRQPFDPLQNVFGGALYLKRLSVMFRGDIVRVIAAYNVGPAVIAREGVPEEGAVLRYVKRVLREYARLRESCRR